MKLIFHPDTVIECRVRNWPQAYQLLRRNVPNFLTDWESFEGIGIILKTGDQYRNLNESEFDQDFPEDVDTVIVIPKARGDWEAAAWIAAEVIGTASVLVTAAVYVVITVALSYAVSAITESLSPSPKDSETKLADQRPSYIFNGAVNVIDPGYPVPLVYGQHLTGSVVLSANIEAREIYPI